MLREWLLSTLETVDYNDPFDILRRQSEIKKKFAHVYRRKKGGRGGRIAYLH